MESAAMLLNFVLAWAFGLVILCFLWWQSMPARDLLMTSIAGIALLASILIGAASFAMSYTRMKTKSEGKRTRLFASFPAMVALVVLLPAIAATSKTRTVSKHPERLAPLNLRDENLTHRPEDWIECEFARRDALKSFADRETLQVAEFESWEKSKVDDFEAEWLRRRDAQIESIGSHDISWADLRNSDLTEAFGVGLKLPPKEMWAGATISFEMLEGTRFFDTRNCQMLLAELPLSQMSLRGARFNGVNFAGGALGGVDLSEASLQGADLSNADLRYADLSGADLQAADLRSAELIGSTLARANLREANLVFAQMATADLSRVTASETNFAGATMPRVNLRRARLENVVLVGADLTGAVLSQSRIVGTKDNPIDMTGTDFSSVQNDYGALRHVNLENALWDVTTDFSTVFLDASVQVPDGFANLTERPCQWLNVELSDEEFEEVYIWWAISSNNTISGLSGRLLRQMLRLRGQDLTGSDRLAELGLADCQAPPLDAPTADGN
ncbi:pentapeptide repeat-containing protein [uncultured Tateyamaria sp.]|uniref:pentapeptide repeat-containing protein n=1 Tax=uncultured Tateyamaria sp. TaxID=455651 RepID=UPI002620CA3B|nr:pentapeptide repeat-containing protein [uncultured Tateyamaria sp.]